MVKYTCFYLPGLNGEQEFSLWFSEEPSSHKNGRDYYTYQLLRHGSILFSGEEFSPSSMVVPHSREAAASLLSFLTLSPRDTDEEYFEKYTPEQLAFANDQQIEYIRHLFANALGLEEL